jgi:hypothetical protein
MVLHEQVWMIACSDPSSDFADIEVVYSLFRILLDPARLTVKEAANIIKEFLEKLGRTKNSPYPVPDKDSGIFFFFNSYIFSY